MISPDTTEDSPVRLNVFALPHQTTILFWLITGVLLLTASVASFSGPPLYLWWVTVGLWFLPIRDVMAYPERHKQRLSLVPATDDYQDLQNELYSAVETLKLWRKPHFVISYQYPKLGLHVFGSLRHWYIAAGSEVADKLQVQLQHKNAVPLLKSTLFHELFHFKMNDYVQMEYLQSLFRTSLKLALWLMIFIIGWILSLWVAHSTLSDFSPSMISSRLMPLSPDVANFMAMLLPPDTEWARVVAGLNNFNFGLAMVFVISAMMPFIPINVVLYLFFWSRFWQARESYADAGALHTQDDSIPLLFTILGIPHNVLPYFKTADIDQLLQAARDLRVKQPQLTKDILTPQYHLPLHERLKAIVKPSEIYALWQVAALQYGGLVLLLDILVVGPLTLPVIADWPMHLTTLLLYALLAFILTPLIVTKGGAWRELLGSVCIAMGLRFVWLVITLIMLQVWVLWNPQDLNATLALLIGAIARYFGFGANLGFEDPEAFVGQAAFVNIAQTGIMFVIILLALGSFHWLLQRLLSWHEPDQNANRFRRRIYGVVLINGVLWGGIVLPLITLVSNGQFSFSQTAIPFIVIAVCTGIVLIAGVWFWKMNRRWGNVCSECGAQQQNTPFYLSKPCCTCKQPLNSWLIATYKV